MEQIGGGREPPKTGASILMTKIPHGDRESLPTWSLETLALRHMQLEMATVWARVVHYGHHGHMQSWYKRPESLSLVPQNTTPATSAQNLSPERGIPNFDAVERRLAVASFSEVQKNATKHLALAHPKNVKMVWKELETCIVESFFDHEAFSENHSKAFGST